MITSFGNFYEQYPQRNKTPRDETRASTATKSDKKRMEAKRRIEMLEMAKEFGISPKELGL